MQPTQQPFNIAGFMHSYTTIFGQYISMEQLKRLRSVDLLKTVRIRCFNSEDEEPQRYEGHTLEILWEYCQGSDGLIWYIHTKGASHPPESQPSQAAFRHALEEVVIDEWQSIIRYFETHPECDCYGAYLTDDTRYFFPGNFWWARASHIRRLPNPIEWATKLCGRKGTDVRYGYEDWVTVSSLINGFDTVARAKYRWRPDDPPGQKTLWEGGSEMITA